jgi:TolA-binding protein
MEDKVKRNYARKAINGGLLFCSTLILTSCSSLWLHRDQTVDSALNEGAQSQPSTVSKDQYDELARKYNDLLAQSKNLKSAEVAPVVAANPTEQSKPHLAEETHIDPSELVNRIDSAIPDAPTLDGVDALATKSPTPGPAVPTSMGVKTVNNSDEIDDQISRLREVQELVKVNKFEQALVILKELEASKEKQIVVRAKMMLGDLLFNQGEFDLSSQVYEEIINKYAFSGFVIKALGKLVVCSEKLKQPEKQAKYYSLLHDFFEAS